MEHGNRFKKELYVQIQFVCSPSKFEIIVKDSGLGGHLSFPTEEPDIDAKVSGKASRRGWGIFLIKNLVDEVFFETILPKGNIVRIISYIESAHEKEVESETQETSDSTQTRRSTYH